MSQDTDSSSFFAPVSQRSKAAGAYSVNSGSVDQIYIDHDLPISDGVFMSVVPGSNDWKQWTEFLEQVQQAFSTKPTLAGVIHGQRRIKLGKRGFRANHFPSTKNAMEGLTSTALPMDSRAETAYGIQLDRNPNVQAYRPQAIRLQLPNGTVFPDFLIIDQAGHIHVRDVKADKRYLSIEMRERADQLSIILSRWGVSYAVVDSFDMPQGTKLINLKWLNQRISSHPNERQIEAFLKLGFKKCTYAELIELCKSQNMEPSLVPYLLFTEKLNVDWQKLIVDSTEVSQ